MLSAERGEKFTTINDSDLSLNSLERTETWRSLLDTGEISGLSKDFWQGIIIRLSLSLSLLVDMLKRRVWKDIQ